MALPYASIPRPTRRHTVVLDHLELHYEEYGRGQPLVLLHGFGGGAANWHPFTEQLAAHYRLLVVELPGHGYSTNPANTFTHREAARAVLQLLDRLGVTHFAAMGLSSGAMTLLHMATSQPQRLESLVLVSATTHFPAQARAIMRAASLRTMPPPVQAMYLACATRGEGQIQALIGQFNALADNEDDMRFTPPQLATITARTLVVHGDRDRFFPVDIALTLYQSIPDAALWVVPGGEHVPIYAATVPFTATALRFLQGPAGQ
jgi:pimeloyl-ACP methyl ester carboxylesterase